jgi:type II secretory ATPase GspE/PulE/Tfp pilus assembly ATPase PilB-like protein
MNKDDSLFIKEYSENQLKLLIEDISLGLKSLKHLLTINKNSKTNIDLLLNKVSDSFNIPIIKEQDFNYKLQDNINIQQLIELEAIPVYISNNILYVLSLNIFNPQIEIHFTKIYNTKIQIVLAKPKLIEKEIAKLSLKHNINIICNNVIDDISNKNSNNSEFSSIDKLIHEVLDYGLHAKASDIHIESLENITSIRYRIDGVLHTLFRLSKNIFAPLMSTIKIMSNISFVKTNVAGDGRFSYEKKDISVDFRVSTLPTIHGESIVIRILNKENRLIELKKLNFSKDVYQKYKKVISKNSGLILTTGPTGCGKTTTLYSTLKDIESENKKIISIEDPVEYQFNSIQQVSINEKKDRTFENILKNILRQDPDVLMIGEIRDKESL